MIVTGINLKPSKEQGGSVSYRFAERIGKLQPSPTVAVSDRVRELKQQGHDVIDLGGGDPDFPTPKHICEAASEALFAGDTHYVASAGIPELRQAITRKLQDDNGVEVDVSGIIVTPGGKSALVSSVLALVGPGDDVLTFDPGWVSYEPMATIAGANTIHVPLDATDNYRITREAIDQHVTPNTRLMIVNSPNNPSGRVLAQDEIDAVCDAAKDHDLIVFSDEIYEKIVYDGNTHISLAAQPGMAERTLTHNGFSKAYAMTGWRLGYVAGPVDIVKQIMKIHSHSVTCATSFAQRGAVAALNGPQDFIGEMVSAWDRRRKLMVDGLNQIPGFHCPMPEGAFYALADVSGTGKDGSEVAEILINEARVGVTPGVAFGDASSNHIRMSFANSDELIEDAVKRMQAAFS
jgi:aspartate aminotransferase